MPSTDREDDFTLGFTKSGFFEYIIEYAPVGVFSTNKIGEIVFANRAMKLLLGRPSEEDASRFNVITHPTTQEAGLDKTFKETLENGLEATFIGPYTSPWGKELYLRLLSAPIVNPNNSKIEGLIGIIEDISSQIRAQETAQRLNTLIRLQAEKLEDTVRERTAELARSEEKFRKLVETMETGLWVADRNEITSYVNPWLERKLGYSHEEMIGRSVFDFIASEDHDKLREVDQQRYEANVTPSSYELTLKAKDGSLIRLLFHGVGLLDSQGKVVETFATISDARTTKEA